VAGDLTARVRDAFGWHGDLSLSPGPRGALGQIWRVEVGDARFALKEIFAEPPSEARIEAEVAFGRLAAAEGVRLPAIHADRAGHRLLTAPSGPWLRLYDWVDLGPVDLTAPATPAAVGALLARLHRCAPRTAVETDGGAPARWYDRVPAPHEWADVCASGAAWAERLAERVATLSDLCAAVAPVDPERLILCHRDLHPDNVFTDPTGALVVVDWDNFGPAEPGRELAQALFDWFGDGQDADLDGMLGMYDAYVREDGPGRITEPADFTMLLACRVNFLLVQARVAIDPQAEPRHRDWAEREIDEGLHLLPAPRQLADVLRQTRRE